MQKTTEILKEVEVMLLQAELRIALLNGDLNDAESLETRNKILGLQVELETIHQSTTKLENVLLKKMNQVLKKRVDILTEELKTSKSNPV